MYDSHYHGCHENFNIFVKTILTKKLWSVKPKISLCVLHPDWKCIFTSIYIITKQFSVSHACFSYLYIYTHYYRLRLGSGFIDKQHARAIKSSVVVAKSEETAQTHLFSSNFGSFATLQNYFAENCTVSIHYSTWQLQVLIEMQLRGLARSLRQS